MAPSVYFSADPGNNDTTVKFYADMQMYALAGSGDPELFMRNFHSSQVPARQNR